MGLRAWVDGRPFAAGLLAVLAGAEILLTPVVGAGILVHTGLAGQLSFLLGLLLVVFGLLFWTAPSLRVVVGALTIAVGLASFLTANLGGFLVGLLLALVGGAAGISWAPAEVRPPGRGRHRSAV
ncbi:hypothetical protein EDD29_2877 [Actinocorallia herbida]|uniref:Integral membrane protein n=1 Tax=Actinocorallia herbida TaxID=58109 RepID=A0A3N1CVR2_9ACTN|nr:DUF6114 domain-containing protein [Actinocorallia herbida]ROO85334.1 hypothetical protein EDD29_2877 [Actinocorallia herbida]